MNLFFCVRFFDIIFCGSHEVIKLITSLGGGGGGGGFICYFHTFPDIVSI